MNIPTRFVCTESINYADTWRDPDDIHTYQLGEYDTLEHALDAMIERHKGENMTPFRYDKNKDEYHASCLCSYGVHVVITPKYN